MANYTLLFSLILLITLSLILASYSFFRLEKVIRTKYPKMQAKGKKKSSFRAGELITLNPSKEKYPMIYRPVNNKEIDKLRVYFKFSWFLYAASFYLFLIYLIMLNVIA